MIEDLQILFTQSEKNLSTLNKVLSILGDYTWEEISKGAFIEDFRTIGLNWFSDSYISLDAVDKLKSPMTVTDFLSMYDPSGDVYTTPTLSITSDEGTTYEFEQPDFECELKFIADGEWIYGHIDDDGLGINHRFMCSWGVNSGTAICVDGLYNFSCYNLSPIKPNWYDVESNFPAIVIDDDTELAICTCKSIWTNVYANHYGNYRLATKAERDRLICQEDLQ